jgi:hypothetical protein
MRLRLFLLACVLIPAHFQIIAGLAQDKLREACFLFPVPCALFPSVLGFAINRR